MSVYHFLFLMICLLHLLKEGMFLPVAGRTYPISVDRSPRRVFSAILSKLILIPDYL